MTPKYPIRGRNETGDVVIDITEIVAPDDAFTEGSGVLQIASSTGDVTGPASSTDNAIARFNGTTGKTIQNSSGFITDGGVIYGVNLAPGLTTTADSVLDAALTVTSTGIQRFTASASGNNVLLPVVTTLPQVGYGFMFVNDTAGSITVASSGGNAVATITTGNRALITCVALTGTTAASWTVTPILSGGGIGGSTGATDNAVLRADGVGGSTLQSSPVSIADTTGAISGCRSIALSGATSGSVTVAVPAVAGSNTVTLPAGTTDFSATGGTGQVVKQDSAGAALTVGAVAVGEVSGLGTGVATQLALNANGTDVDAIGFRGIPQNSQADNYTLVLADAGKHIYETGASKTVTIPANASVAYEIGTAVTFIATNATGCSIAITTDTMTLAGTTTTGTRTLAQNGMATAVKVTSTSWIISGTGLT